MATLYNYGRVVNSVFQLLGHKENHITFSLAWALKSSEIFACELICRFLEGGNNWNRHNCLTITTQEYDKEGGISDIELKDGNDIHIICEAKRGWAMPSKEQIETYILRKEFAQSTCRHKMIVTISECSQEYASRVISSYHLNSNVKHISYKEIYELLLHLIPQTKLSQRRILDELRIYFEGLMTMQAQNSNWVYVVSLSDDYIKDSKYTWKDVVNTFNRYTHPVGNTWPTEPPNYIAFRYGGKLQSIHHIEDYKITKRLYDECEAFPRDSVEDTDSFIYTLGPAITPNKIVRTGGSIRAARRWAMLDTLLTSDTLLEAIEISKKRK